MEQDTSVSPGGDINLDAKPKKSILKRSDPEAGGPGGQDAEGDAAEEERRHVPFSRIIPELSRLEEEDAKLGSAAGAAAVAAGTSDLQSVSSAASLSPLSSDEELDGGSKEPSKEPAEVGDQYYGRMYADRMRRPRRRVRRRRAPGPHYLPDAEPLSPSREMFSPPHDALPPHHRRSPSPVRLVRYSPGPDPHPHHPHHHRMRPRHSRSPARRSPPRRSHSRRSRSRSPRRRSRSPGRYRRGPSPRYGRSPGRRRWSRSPSPRRRRSRSRSRSRSPPWGRNVEHSLLALSQGGAAPGYGAPPGPPGYPAVPYPAPGLPPHPGFVMAPAPFPGAPPGPPVAVQMLPGARPPFGQPAFAPPGVPVTPQPVTPQPQLTPQPAPPGTSPNAPTTPGISEHIDSNTFLREVERRKQLKSAQQAQRQRTGVQAAVSPAAAGAGAEVPKPEKLPAEESEELKAIKKKKPWMTQVLLNLKAELASCDKKNNRAVFLTLARQWNNLVAQAKQRMEMSEVAGLEKRIQESDKVVKLSPSTVERLMAQQREQIAQRDRLAGELHQLKVEQKQLDNSNVIMKAGKPTTNKQLHDNLKKQSELLTALDSVSQLVASLKQVLDPEKQVLPAGSENGVRAVLKLAKGENKEATAITPKSEVSYLLLGDETLSAVQVYIREQASRGSFGTSLAPERIRLVSRPDAALSSVEFRHWVRAAVRQSSAETLVLLASVECLGEETAAWSAAAAVAPLLPLLRDLRADGLTRVVVVGVPVDTGGSGGTTGGSDGTGGRAAQFNRALQELLESAGPHVPRVVFTPVRGEPQDGFAVQTEGGLTLDLYTTLVHVIGKCEQKPQTMPGLPGPAGSGQLPQLSSVEDASEALQGLLDGLRGRLAGDEAAGLGAVAALLDKMKQQGEVAEQLLMEREQQNLNAEDPAVFFRDPADHVCLHCKTIFLNAKSYLEHLKSADHMKQYMISHQNVPESPWRKDIPPIEKKVKNAKSRPIKGLDMFIRVDCWYCKVCEMFIGDLRCASSHLKSRRHNAKYDEYLENNPGYHAVVGETRSRLLVECAQREEERTRKRRREEAQKRGDRMNEKMRRQSESGVQDVTDEAGAAAAGAAAAAAVGGKKAGGGIKLNLLAAPQPPPEELGQLKRKVQANIAAEQEAKRVKEEEKVKEVEEDKEGREVEKEGKVKQEEKEEKEEEVLVPTVSNQPGAEVAAAAKVKITLSDKTPQKPAAGAPAKKKVMPIVGKLPKLRPKKLEPTKPPSSDPPGGQLPSSERATLELANRREVLAAIPPPSAPPPPAAAAGPPGEESETGGMQDLLDIDLPDADDDRRAEAEELKMLGICDEDVAAQQLPATRPPL